MPPTSDSLIVARGLTKRFGEFTAVDGIDVEVHAGEAFGFLGPNGAGKSSTMRMIGCVSSPSAGSMHVFGLDAATHGAQIRARIGVVPQLDTLDTELSVKENLWLYGRFFDLPRGEARRRAAELLEFAQLTDRADSIVDNLSGGMKRRLSIARSLINEPELLLLDEPTAGVDPKARREFWEELHALAARGISILVSTHYMDEAERCHQLAYIAYGTLMAQGSAQEIIAAQGLATWAIVGGDLAAIAQRLQREPGVEQLAAFGAALHVTSRDGAVLEAALRRVTAGTGSRIEPADTGLEDVFIHLMGRSSDDFDARR